MHVVNSASAHDLQLPRRRCSSSGATGKSRPKGPLRHRAFQFTVVRKPSVSHRFLAPSLLRLWYPFVESAFLPLHRACFHPASNRREDFRGRLFLSPRTVRIWGALNCFDSCSSTVPQLMRAVAPADPPEAGLALSVPTGPLRLRVAILLS